MMVLLKEKTALFGKSFDTGLHSFPFLNNLIIYNEHLMGLNYLLLSSEVLSNAMYEDARYRFLRNICFDFYEIQVLRFFV